MRGAIPVLTRAIRVEDAHPSVGLLSGATLLAMKLVAAGRVRLSETGDSWRVGPLQPDDEDRLRALATARAHADTDVDEAEDVIRQLLDAVADTMTRPPELHDTSTFVRRPRVDSDRRRGPRPARPGPPRAADRGARRGARGRRRGRRAPGPRRGRRHPLRRRRPAVARPGSAEGHGFSGRARLSLGRALRAATKAWSPLDRLQRMQVPDRMVLDADELADLLEHGLEALDGDRRRRVLAARAARRAGAAGPGRRRVRVRARAS